MKTILSLALLAALAGCGSSSDSPPDDDAPDAGLPDGVSALAGTGPELPPTDLAAFDAVVGNAKYIGLGEAVHTSGGFYAAKRRLIEHLVRDSGLRVFAMETPRTDAQKLDAYINTTCGNSQVALQYIFPVFVDDNTQSLFEWLCAWNTDHPSDRVRFFGFDEQQPAQDHSQLDAFLTHYVPADRDALIAGIAMCRSVQSTSEPPYPDNDLAACTSGLDAIDAELAARRAELVTAAGEESVRLAEIAALSFRSWQGEDRYLNDDIGRSYEIRDVAMHQIFAALRDLYFPDERVILWAANYHLMRHHSETDDFTEGARTFGEELAAEVGDDAYAAIALTGNKVGINWVGQSATALDPASTRSLVQRLTALDQPYLFADTKAAFVGPTRQILRDEADGPMDIASQFAGVVYLDDSPGMNALYW